MTSTGSPFRYLPIHLREVALGRVLPFAVIAIGVIVILPDSVGSNSAPAVLGSGDTLIRLMVMGTLLIATLIAAGSVAGTDIKSGYYRTLFSKPIAPWWYYLERWLLGGVAVLVIPLLLAAGYLIVGWQVRGLDGALFGGVALGYLLIGGAVLLLSTVTPRDWLVVFLVAFMEVRLHDIQPLLDSGSAQRVINFLVTVLPPFHLINEAIRGTATQGELLHVIGYGLALVVAALLVFRFRPMGSGGRS